MAPRVVLMDGRRFIPAPVVAAVALVASFGFAAEPGTTRDGRELTRARTLFAAAEEAERQGDWSLAADRLRQAVHIKETPGLRFHLGHCETELGHLLAAREQYERARALIDDGAEAPDVDAALVEAEAQLLSRVPTLKLRLTRAPAGVELRVDGAVLPTESYSSAVPLDPGTHTVEVSAPGHDPTAHVIELTESSHRELALTLGVVRAVPPEAKRASTRPDPLRPSGSSWRGAALIAEGAVTLAGLATGGVFLWRRSAHAERVTELQTRLPEVDACVAPLGSAARSCSALADSIDDHERAEVLVVAGFASAAVGAGALLGTFWLWPEDESPGAVQARAQPLPGGMLLRVQGAL